MARVPDVAVIGGGIVGVATAAELARSGAHVTLFERGSAVAAGASGRNAGEICQPPDPALAQLFHDSLARYRELEGEPLGPDEAFRLGDGPIGVLEVAFDPDLVRRVAATVAAAQPDLHIDLVDAPTLARLEPRLAPGLAAYRVDTGYPVRPADATRAFAALATRLGVTLRTGTSARPWFEGNTARGVDVAGERIAADWVVVAAGPWTAELVDPTGVWRPIRPLWGVIVEMALDPPFTHVVGELLGEGPPMLSLPTADDPPDTGSLPAPVLGINPAPSPVRGGPAPVGLGGTLAPVEPDPRRVAPALVAHAQRFIPSLHPSQMGAIRLCARPASDDARPLIGLLPGVERLVVVAGNGAWGISTGPATARLGATVVLAGGDAHVPEELRASRFGAPPHATGSVATSEHAKR